MRANIKRTRDDEDPAANALRLPRGRAAQLVQEVDARLAHVAKTPQDLSRRDMIELYNILQLAIGGHSTQYKATAPMLDSFVEAVYRGWQDKSQFVQPVGRPPVFPYRNEGDTWGMDKEEKDLWVFSYEDINEDEVKAMRKAHPNFKSGYYNVEVDFHDKSFDFYITGETYDSRDVSESVNRWDVSKACKHAIARDITQYLGRLCDKHNEGRAVQYARFYI